MSMICSLNRISTSLAQELLCYPERITELLDAGLPPAPQKHLGFLQKLLTKKPIEPTPPSRYMPIGEDDICDLDSSWHLLHYFFTGTAWDGVMPASFLLKGGADIGNVDVGYGPARCFMPEEVQRIAGFLGGITLENMQKYNDGATMQKAEIYGINPKEKGVGLNDEQMGYLMDYVAAMKKFTDETAQTRQAILIYLF